MRSIVAPGLISILLIFAAVVPAGADEWQYSRTFDQQIPAGSAMALALHGDNGDVRLIATSTNQVSVHAKIEARNQAAVSATNVTLQPGNRIDVDARCPQSNRLFGYTNACNVDITVTYPQGLRVTVDWVNGDVHTEDPHGDLTVHLTNGDVVVGGATRSVTLSTRHGDVEASLSNGWHGTTIDLAASEGDVTVHVPRGLHAYLDASSHVGDVVNKANLPTVSSNSAGIVVHATTLFGDVTITN
jgi:hypothetical protein